MTKASRYDTVVLCQAVASFPPGEIGVVVEVYTAPYEAYDVELVADDGTTKALLEHLRPEQFDLAPSAGSPTHSNGTHSPQPANTA